MNNLAMNKVSEVKVVDGVNPKVIAYLQSDLYTLSPLFEVQGVLGNQAAANYVMTTLFKAYKEQSVNKSVFATNAVIKTAEAFRGSTKSEEVINAGIKECERLSLIKHDNVYGEITMFSNCFKVAYVD